MRLICYPTSGEPPRMIAAPVERDWMERTPNGFAYRCLPLNIAKTISAEAGVNPHDGAREERRLWRFLRID